MNPKGYRCANCGKMLPVSRTGIMKCECCGSEYKVEDDYSVSPIRVEQLPFNVKIIQGRVDIPQEILHTHPQEAFESTLHRMAEQMAEKLMPLMQLDIGYEPMRMNYSIGAKIRVAYPSIPPQEVFQKAVSVDPDIVSALKAEGERQK